MATDKDFEDKGYRKWPPSAIDCPEVLYYYQKRFDGRNETKYFITAKMWRLELHNSLNDVHTGFEYEVQLYQKETHNAMNLSFLTGWSLDDVEEYVEKIYQTGLFDPYESRPWE